MHLLESTNMLKDAGIQFDFLRDHGIEPMIFWDGIIGSGAVMNPEIIWVTFHGASDFAYFLRGLRNRDLPDTLAQFYQEVKTYFPRLFDIKVIISKMRYFKNGSLQKLAYDLEVQRLGTQHQAGSDSHLTAMVFHVLKRDHTE